MNKVLITGKPDPGPASLREPAVPTPAGGRGARRRPGATVALYVCLAAVVVLSVAPMLWVISTSLKTTAEVFAPQVSWIPRSPTLDNFERAVTEYPLVAWMTNSVVIAFWTIVLSCLLHIMAAYALAKLRFPFKRLLLVTLLATIMIPRELTSVPVYKWVRDWGLMDTHAAVYLPQVAEAITVFLLVQFFRSLPDELIEAARLDGASHWTILWRIFVPLARPAIAVVVILSFVNSWNSFFWPLLVTFSDGAVPLPVGLASIMASASEASAARQYGLLMAISLIASVPTMAIFLILQRRFVAAVTSTGLKG